jgi:hypothetical protein
MLCHAAGRAGFGNVAALDVDCSIAPEREAKQSHSDQGNCGNDGEESRWLALTRPAVVFVTRDVVPSSSHLLFRSNEIVTVTNGIQV